MYNQQKHIQSPKTNTDIKTFRYLIIIFLAGRCNYLSLLFHNELGTVLQYSFRLISVYYYTYRIYVTLF